MSFIIIKRKTMIVPLGQQFVGESRSSINTSLENMWIPEKLVHDLRR